MNGKLKHCDRNRANSDAIKYPIELRDSAVYVLWKNRPINSEPTTANTDERLWTMDNKERILVKTKVVICLMVAAVSAGLLRSRDALGYADATESTRVLNTKNTPVPTPVAQREHGTSATQPSQGQFAEGEVIYSDTDSVTIVTSAGTRLRIDLNTGRELSKGAAVMPPATPIPKAPEIPEPVAGVPPPASYNPAPQPNPTPEPFSAMMNVVPAATQLPAASLPNTSSPSTAFNEQPVAMPTPVLQPTPVPSTDFSIMATIESSDGKANIRSKPNLESDIVSVMSSGMRVSIIGMDDQWAEVRTPMDTTGYVSRSLHRFLVGISDAPISGVIASSDGRATMRAGPSVTDKEIATLMNECKVAVMGVEGRWCSVQLESRSTGWVARNLITPTSNVAYWNGWKHYDYGEFEQAESAFTEAIRGRQNLSESHRLRGVVRRKQGNHQGAYDDFSAVLAIDPNNSAVYLNRALSYLHAGERDRAQADLDRCFQLKPELIAEFERVRGKYEQEFGIRPIQIQD